MSLAHQRRVIKVNLADCDSKGLCPPCPLSQQVNSTGVSDSLAESANPEALRVSRQLVSILHMIRRRRTPHGRGRKMKKTKGPSNIGDVTTHPIPSRRDQLLKKVSRTHRVGKLVIISGRGAGREFQCYSQTTFLGRNRENHVTLMDTSASRRHARIERRNGDFILEDLKSTNGTILNQKTISREMLHHGDKIQIGETVLQFIVEEKS